MEFISYNFYLGTVNDGWQLNPCKFSLAAFFQWERKGGDDFQVLNMFAVEIGDLIIMVCLKILSFISILIT